MKVALVIEHQGQAFSGWQIQARGIRTVQGELEDALLTYFKSKASSGPTPARLTLTGSGRTDSGVHARGQVASFLWPDCAVLDCDDLKRALNGITSPEIAIHEVRHLDESFDARFSPHRKRYSYLIEHGVAPSPLGKDRSWWLPKTLNVKDMILASRDLVGTQDFAGFRAVDCSAETTIRTVVKSELELVSNGNLLFVIEGKGFLKNMVRIIVGTLVEIGQGKRKVDAIRQVLQSCSREDAGMTAPAAGLCLEYVDYGDLWKRKS